jgi:hypothetical protein
MRLEGDIGQDWEDLTEAQQEEYEATYRFEGNNAAPSCSTRWDGWVCTRPRNHEGPHFAGSGRSFQIFAIWEEWPEDLRMDVGL